MNILFVLYKVTEADRPADIELFSDHLECLLHK